MQRHACEFWPSTRLDFPGWQVYLDGPPLATSYRAPQCQTGCRAGVHRGGRAAGSPSPPPGATSHAAASAGYGTLPPGTAAGLVLGSLLVVGRRWRALLKISNPARSTARTAWLAGQTLVLLGAAGLVLVVSARALRYVAGPDDQARTADSRIVLDFALAADAGTGSACLAGRVEPGIVH